jgi:hypothetical protein
LLNKVLLASLACFALGCTSAQAQDLALNQPATASSTEGGLSRYEPANANDGNSSTRWSSEYVDNQWWQVDLGSIRSINRVELNWEAAYARQYRIQTRSSTTNPWSTAATITISSPGLTTHTFATRTARYVRIQGDIRATTWGISLWDARVCNISCLGPSPPPPTDGDGDGVPDDSDECPNQPGSAASGCPATPEPPASGWVLCANEGQWCAFNGTQEVRYGADTRWTTPRQFTGGVACANSVFGDPAFGARKRCEWRPVTTTPPPPDSDDDGVPDSQDHCPNQSGPASNNGCPLQQPPQQPPSSRPFPRLMMTHYGIRDAADAKRLARWDWIVVGGANATTVSLTPQLRPLNPNIKITPYVDGTEDNGYEGQPAHVSPTNSASGFSSQWWLKNADGSFANYPHSPGRKMINPTQFTPAVNGKRWNEHLAEWLAIHYKRDGVLVDMVSDSSCGCWPGWTLTARVPNVDLDRNAVRDVAEHGAAWVNNTWGAAMRDLMAKIRAAIGPDKLLIGNNGIGFNRWANGLSMEAGSTDNNELNLFQGWISNHFGPDLYATQQTQGGSPTNYRLMRHNLVAAMMVDAYFNYSDGAGGNYTSLWWYDEYSVDFATGQATGDASEKGYLGQATGAAVKLSNGVWRRDFANGIALVNNSGSTQTVSLGGTFRRIRGTQDPTVNSGASVSSVSLPPQDAVILLR